MYHQQIALKNSPNVNIFGIGKKTLFWLPINHLWLRFLKELYHLCLYCCKEFNYSWKNIQFSICCFATVDSFTRSNVPHGPTEKSFITSFIQYLGAWRHLRVKPVIISGYSNKDHHIETSQLICTANRSTDLYIIRTLNLYGLINRVVMINLDLSLAEYLQTTLYKIEYV